MRPLAVLTAILFGSSAAISFGLTATVIVFFTLRSEQPQLAREMPALLGSCAGFLAMSAISGGCLYATLKQLRWQWVAQAIMWLSVAVIGYAYWPRR